MAIVKLSEVKELLKNGTVAEKSRWARYKKPVVITVSVVVLQLLFGWDAKFCIINIIWLFV